MRLSRKMKIFAVMLMLSLLTCLFGCDSSGQPLFPNTQPGQTATQSSQDENVNTVPTEPPVQNLPDYSKNLGAVQCYYQGQLQREYVIAYDEQGRISTLTIHTYDKGNLYSWGENHYEYDDRDNLVINNYVYSQGTQRWEYENVYDDQGCLIGYQETEFYNEQVVSSHRKDCLYDDLGRYLGSIQPEEVSFDEFGRVTSIRVKAARGDYLADMDVTCDYSCMPVMLCNLHTVFPEYEQFSADLRVMLNRYHVLFGLDMRDGYRTVTDADGYLTRVTDDSGSDVYVFIYN